MSAVRVFYVADPMCSWCWGFASVLEAVEPTLRADIELQLVLGGLAPDSELPMDEATRRYVQRAWRAVESQTGARFEHSFWERCQPRRSTWPACRAVLAAGERGRDMFGAIQKAYYTEARDPSDPETLVTIGRELGFEEGAFAATLAAPETQTRLEEDFALRRKLGVHGFPSLAIERDGELGPITNGWVDAANLRAILGRLRLLE
jgi:putative protein-disulfide isomerase